VIRLHIVGKSKDNRRLFPAKTKGGTFGSFEIPISRKLLKLIEQVEEARNSHRRTPSKAGEAPAALPRRRAGPAPTRRRA
jgi:hypothetical protein